MGWAFCRKGWSFNLILLDPFFLGFHHWAFASWVGVRPCVHSLPLWFLKNQLKANFKFGFSKNNMHVTKQKDIFKSGDSILNLKVRHVNPKI